MLPLKNDSAFGMDPQHVGTTQTRFRRRRQRLLGLSNSVFCIIDQHAREALALSLRAHVEAVVAMLKLQERLFKHVPAIGERLRSYDVLKAT